MTNSGDAMNFQVEFEQEADGRWIAEVSDLPGVLAYGRTREEALALRMLARIAKHTGLAPEDL